MSFIKTFMFSIILLAGVFYVTGYVGGQKAEEAKKQGKKIFNFKKSDIFFLRVRGGGGEDFEMEKQNGAWRMVSPIKAGADGNEVEDLISYVSSAEFEEVIHASEKQFGAFGLGVHALTIDFYLSAETRKGKPYRLAIGEYSPTKRKVYIKTSISESVLVMENVFKNRVMKTISRLRKKRTLSGKTGNS